MQFTAAVDSLVDADIFCLSMSSTTTFSEGTSDSSAPSSRPHSSLDECPDVADNSRPESSCETECTIEFSSDSES